MPNPILEKCPGCGIELPQVYGQVAPGRYCEPKDSRRLHQAGQSIHSGSVVGLVTSL